MEATRLALGDAIVGSAPGSFRGVTLEGLTMATPRSQSYRRWFTKVVHANTGHTNPRAARLYRNGLEWLEDRCLLATLVWSGLGTGGSWGTAANWVGGQAPQTDDDLVFPATAAQFDTIDNYALGNAFHSITFLAPGYTIETAAGTAPLELSGGIITSYAGGTSLLKFPVVLTGPQSFTASTAATTLEFDGTVDLAGNALTFDGPGTVSFPSGGIQDTGTGGAAAILEPGAGTLNIGGPCSYAGSTTVAAGGKIVLSSPGALGTGAVVVQSSGTAPALLINANSGATLALNNPLTLKGQGGACNCKGASISEVTFRWLP